MLAPNPPDPTITISARFRMLSGSLSPRAGSCRTNPAKAVPIRMLETGRSRCRTVRPSAARKHGRVAGAHGPALSSTSVHEIGRSGVTVFVVEQNTARTLAATHRDRVLRARRDREAQIGPEPRRSPGHSSYLPRGDGASPARPPTWGLVPRGGGSAEDFPGLGAPRPYSGPARAGYVTVTLELVPAARSLLPFDASHTKGAAIESDLGRPQGEVVLTLSACAGTSPSRSTGPPAAEAGPCARSGGVTAGNPEAPRVSRRGDRGVRERPSR